MNQVSQEYIAAIALIVVGILQAFGVGVEQNTIVGILTGLGSLWIAIRRYQKKDISIIGVRK